VNKTPCLYLCSFPFVVAALLLVGSLASLAWILTYSTVMIQILTRSLIHQFSRYLCLCLFLFLGRWFFLLVFGWTLVSVLAPTLSLDLHHWGQVLGLPVFCLPHPPLPHQLAPRCSIPGLAIPLKGIPMRYASQSQCCLRSSCSPVTC